MTESLKNYVQRTINNLNVNSSSKSFFIESISLHDLREDIESLSGLVLMLTNEITEMNERQSRPQTDTEPAYLQILSAVIEVANNLVDDLSPNGFGINCDTLISDIKMGPESLDSLAMMEIIIAVEERFDIKLPDNRVDHIKTVGDFVKLIEEFSKR